MIVSDFISLVKDGSLAQTAITEASVIKFINIGLTELYSKFNLSNKEITITLTEGTDKYLLPSDFMNVFSITTDGIYFRDNLGVITPITEDTFELSVNIHGDYNSVFFNTPGVITVPLQVTGQVLTIVYKTSPVVITDQSLNEEVDIPSQLLEPLMLYVTYLGFMQNGGGTPTDTNLYLSRYKAAVLELTNTGDYLNQYKIDNKFFNRGFV